ncbi:hypothetical protein PR202_gb26255 [Eleusine coracana subsp. coracana]|uniref:RING-type E3 ubiquitin transferase n=1 Tax=Eleusine coracana subsp. coracana TaxID=191504 RepID=A0AAV5FRQ6_ELECO|nr:hypothetical protein PR202_gb26255 [Eleusine coracana subsp. coracana]
MARQRKLQLIGALLLPLFAVASSFDFFHRNNQGANPMGGSGGQQGPFIPHEYVRFADVKRECKSILSAATLLAFDANRANALLPELSFTKGDWSQPAAGAAPLLPFDGTDVPADDDVAADPVALASFSLTHVDAEHRGKTALNVSGVLGLAVSRNGTGPEMGPVVSPEAKVWPGSTEVKVLFEGVYTETDDGDRVLCMVGDALLPKRSSSTDAGGEPWAWAKHTDRDNFQPPVSKDGSLVLVLRYPAKLTLTTRAVKGELRSTHGKSDAAYFDAVQVVSQLGAYSNYRFGSEEIVGKACTPYPYKDDILAANNGKGGLYRGENLCSILDRFTAEDVLAVVPNWRCNATAHDGAACKRLGPFEIGSSKAVADPTDDGAFTDVSIVMQDVRCEPRENGRSARVSAVFRAVPPWEHAYAAGQRSGLGGATLAAEGVWRAATGQLCMLTLSGAAFANVSTLFLEGVYNPVDGRMYLIGCRPIHAARRAFATFTAVEAAMDCSIEVKVEYPPTTARWLINPTAKVHIASTRAPDDPLRFNATSLQTLPIMYRAQRQDILSRRGVEGVLRIATLGAAIGAELNQLLYIKAHTDVMPYVSLVMLGVQAVGYSVPLITGAEALFARIATSSSSTPDDAQTPPSYEVDKGGPSGVYWTIDCVVKILILAAFLLTLRLAQKVWRSRIRMLTRSPLEPGRVPSDRRVLLYCSAAHAVGFAVILTAHYVNVYRRPGPIDASESSSSTTYMDARGHTHALREWAVTMEEYIGLAQDLFLLPQVVGNVVWRINCAPLKKSYYAGLTAVRLLPHLYDYVRAPEINPYFAEEYEFVNTSLDFYSRVGDVVIPLAAVALAAAVYVQQRWNYKIISRTVKTQQKKLQHLGSRVYERLPSMSSANFEAELVSGVNEGAALRRDTSLGTA